MLNDTLGIVVVDDGKDDFHKYASFVEYVKKKSGHDKDLAAFIIPYFHQIFNAKFVDTFTGAQNRDARRIGGDVPGTDA